ncbi:MAG: hypothetical protein ACK48Y_03855, partial [Planctomyces sp.]
PRRAPPKKTRLPAASPNLKNNSQLWLENNLPQADDPYKRSPVSFLHGNLNSRTAQKLPPGKQKTARLSTANTAWHRHQISRFSVFRSLQDNRRFPWPLPSQRSPPRAFPAAAVLL